MRPAAPCPFAAWWEMRSGCRPVPERTLPPIGDSDLPGRVSARVYRQKTRQSNTRSRSSDRVARRVGVVADHGMLQFAGEGAVHGVPVLRRNRIACSASFPATKRRKSQPAMTTRRPHVLLIGPRVIEDDIVGGTKVSFECLLADLMRRKSLSLTVVNTSRGRRNRGLWMRVWLDLKTFVVTLVRLWRHARFVHLVIWNVSPRGAILGGPCVWFLCLLRRRPLFIRFFGGDLDSRLASSPAVIRFMADRTFLRADLLLLQTRQLVEAFALRFTAAWFPTTRNMPRRRQDYSAACWRLVFLGQLHPEKGLPELLAAAEQFPPGVTLSVFGPRTPEFDPRAFDRLRNAVYRGTVPPERVPEILEAHDVLVLPSRRAEEGYPGVIVEAFQMGLPAIAAALPPIRELVTDEVDGLLVRAGSVDSLVDAVIRVVEDASLFGRLRAAALSTGERFRSDRAAARLEALCCRTLSQREPSCAES